MISTAFLSEPESSNRSRFWFFGHDLEVQGDPAVAERVAADVHWEIRGGTALFDHLEGVVVGQRFLGEVILAAGHDLHSQDSGAGASFEASRSSRSL